MVKAQAGINLRIMHFLLMMILVITLFSISAYAIRESEFTDDGYIIVYPDNPDMAADYKMNYAMMNPGEFAKSRILIYDYDIQYVQRALKVAQEACAQNGKPNCADDVKGYQDALAVFADMKSRQKENSPETAPAVSPVGGEKAKSGAFGQLSKFPGKIKDLLGATLDTLRDAWSKLW